ELIHTPNAKTISEIAAFLNLPEDRFVKTIIYKIDNQPYAILISGTDEINETKVRKLLKAETVEIADEETVKKVTNAEVGFAGPIDLDIPVIMDEKVLNLKNFIVGANKTDYHYKNVNLQDFTVKLTGDLRLVKEKEKCPICGGKIYFKKGIEVGNIFKLGTKYSEALDLYYSDQNNQLNPVIMGSYGIGIGRIMAAVVEQNNDEKGMIWPLTIAPYQVGIVIINSNDPEQIKIANQLYEELKSNNIEVLLDDRDERPGIKFNDLDLIGIPLRITIGNKIKDNLVELKGRTETDSTDILIQDVLKETIKKSS
ncbi:MAG: proline--tRNA ligase, partial [Mollicutes bacterium]|nr:proline--tRNA ligase [Mollicutes bacterium]